MANAGDSPVTPRKLLISFLKRRLLQENFSERVVPQLKDVFRSQTYNERDQFFHRLTYGWENGAYVYYDLYYEIISNVDEYVESACYSEDRYIELIDWAVFTNSCTETLQKHIVSWSRIEMLITLTTELILASLKITPRQEAAPLRLIDWCERYFQGNIEEWIEAHGGFENQYTYNIYNIISDISQLEEALNPPHLPDTNITIDDTGAGNSAQNRVQPARQLRACNLRCCRLRPAAIIVTIMFMAGQAYLGFLAHQQ